MSCEIFNHFVNIDAKQWTVEGEPTGWFITATMLHTGIQWHALQVTHWCQSQNLTGFASTRNLSYINLSCIFAIIHYYINVKFSTLKFTVCTMWRNAKQIWCSKSIIPAVLSRRQIKRSGMKGEEGEDEAAQSKELSLWEFKSCASKTLAVQVKRDG